MKTKQQILAELYDKYHKNHCETYEDPESDCSCGLIQALNIYKEKYSDKEGK